MNEARTVLPAVMLLENHGSDAVQNYMDSFSAPMDHKSSPEHQIAVLFGDDHILQTHSSHTITDEQIAKFIAAPVGGHARQIVDSHRGAGDQTDDVTLLKMEFQSQNRLDATPSKAVQEMVRKAFQVRVGSQSDIL